MSSPVISDRSAEAVQDGMNVTGAARAAVVDPYSTGAHLARVFAERNVQTVAVVGRDSAASQHATMHASDYVHVHHFDGDYPAACRVLAELDVAYVLAGCESGITLADQLAWRLGIRGNSPANSIQRREKSVMAAALDGAELAHARTLRCDSASAARNAAALLESWPVVIKPTASTGSDHVYVARNLAEVETAAHTILGSRDVFGAPNDMVVVQQYLAGPQYAVNTVSRGGRHALVEVWSDARTDLRGCRGIYDRMELLPPDHPIVAKLFDYVEQCLDALGVAEGPAHSEVVLTPNGPVLVETGARLQGSDSVSLMRLACGLSQADVAVDALVSGADKFTAGIGEAYSYIQPVTKVMLQAPHDGAIGGAGAIKALLAIPGVVGTVHPLRTGAPVRATVDLGSSPGIVYLAGRAAEVEAAYRAVRAIEGSRLYVSAASEREGA